PVLDPHRHPDADRAGTGGHARAAAVHARALHDRARAAAVRARLGEGEVPLAAAGHALAVAGRADLRAGARPGPGAVAHGARARAGQLELDHRAFGGLTEVQRGLGLDVRAAVRLGFAGAAVEQPAEQVVHPARRTAAAGRAEDVAQVEVGGGESAAAPLTGPESAAAEAAPAAGREHRARLVVLLALGRIGEHRVGLADALELRFGRGVAGVGVGMVLPRQLPVGLLDLVLRRGGGDAQIGVIVSLHPFTLRHGRPLPPSSSCIGSASCGPVFYPSSSADASSARSSTTTIAWRRTRSPWRYPVRSTVATTGTPSPPACCTASCRAGSHTWPSAPNAASPCPVSTSPSLSAKAFSGPDSRSPCARARSRSSSTPSSAVSTEALAAAEAACSSRLARLRK